MPVSASCKPDMSEEFHGVGSSGWDVGGSTRDSMRSTDSRSTSTPTPPPTQVPPDVVKDGKETKKEKGSWMKTIGMRTLRLRKGGDGNKSKLPRQDGAGSDGHKNEQKKSDGISMKNGSESNSTRSSIKSTHKDINGGTHENYKKEDPKKKKESDDAHSTSQDPRKGSMSDKQDPGRFIGEGLTFKAKLIGVLEVSGPRGDRICQEALSELKMAVKAAGEHKQKITIHIALDGIRIRDEKTADCLYHHQVHKISFIAQDLTDARAFGYIFGSPDSGHRFFGIKTDKSASQVVIAMRDLFQVVFDLKKKEIERAKQQLELQQKYLAAKGSEPMNNKTSQKLPGMHDSLMDGACVASSSSSFGTEKSKPPAEVDLLNLEVELTSLQEGLDNIHHNLESSSSAPFKGSSASISSDPMSANKFSNPIPSTSNVNIAPAPLPCISSASGAAFTSEAFNDRFDPFDTSKIKTTVGSTNMVTSSFSSAGGINGKLISSTVGTPGISSDPFTQVDPFDTHFKYSDGEYLAPDFFTEENSSNYSSSDIKKASVPLSTDHSSISRAPYNQRKTDMDVPVVNSKRGNDGWKASFEEGFVSESFTDGGQRLGDGCSELDIFTELDPLGTGKVKPFVERTEFFQDLKNPMKKALNDLCDSNSGSLHSSMRLKTSSVAALAVSTVPSQSGTSSIISNSFSTNFTLSDTGLKTSSISHAVLNEKTSGNAEHFPSMGMFTNCSGTPPPMLPPPNKTSTSGSFSRPSSSKKSPQLLKQMTISGALGSSPCQSPRSSCSSRYDFAPGSSGEDIPNLTPPPRPPHSYNVSTLPSKIALSSTALPRPSSGERLRKPSTGSISGGTVPPEPPPRPLSSTMAFSSPSPIKLVSPPPPLPPKKQQSTSFSTNSAESKPNFSKNLAKASSVQNDDLPLPLPMLIKREPSYVASSSRYEIPKSLVSSRGEESAPSIDVPCCSKASSGKMTMEQALNQVASLSLGELASQLNVPVQQLSSLTFIQLAEKLTQNYEESYRPSPSPHTTRPRPSSANDKVSESSSCVLGFEDDFSNASISISHENVGRTQSFSNEVAARSTSKSSSSGFDKYAVFRELTIEDASGFSLNPTTSNSSLENADENDTLKNSNSHLTSSSDRTIKAEDHIILRPGQGIGGIDQDEVSAAALNSVSNTMDDVTDANLSEDDERFPTVDLEYDGSKPKEETTANEWASFDDNFEDQFASLMKDNDDEEEDEDESPSWESDLNSKSAGVESKKDSKKSSQTNYSIVGLPLQNNKTDDLFDFNLFNKPSDFIKESQIKSVSAVSPMKKFADKTPRDDLEKNKMDFMENSFLRKGSGSSKHSRESREDYNEVQKRQERKYKEDDRNVDTRSQRSGRYPRPPRSANSQRSDSRSSYSSLSRPGRKYSRDEEDYYSDEDYDLDERHRRSGRRYGHRRHGSRRSDAEIEDDIDLEGSDHVVHSDDKSRYSRGYGGGSSSRRQYEKDRRHYHHSRKYRERRDRDYCYFEHSPERRSKRYDPESCSDSEDFEEEGSCESGSFSESRRMRRRRERDYRYESSPYDDERDRDRYSRHKVTDRRHSGGSRSGYRRHQDRYYRDVSPRSDRHSRSGRRRREENEYSDELSGSEDSRYKGRSGGRRRRQQSRSPSWDSASDPGSHRRRHRISAKDDDCYEQSHQDSEGRAAPSSHKTNDSNRKKCKQADYHCRDEDDVVDNASTKAKRGASSGRGNQNGGPCKPLEKETMPSTTIHRSHEVSNFQETLSSIERVGQPSPFQDDFLPMSSDVAVANDNVSSIEAVEPPEKRIQTRGSSSSQQVKVFFPTSFDDEKECIDNCSNANTMEILASMMETTGFSDAGNGPTSPVSNNKKAFSRMNSFSNRLESIRSEEEKCDSCENDDNNSIASESQGRVETERKDSTMPEEEEESNAHDGVHEVLPNEEEVDPNMKKSDSFNIFQQAQIKDPFGDDDFFK